MAYPSYDAAIIDLATKTGARLQDLADWNASQDAATVASRSRATHTGTQPASTISDFTAVVDARIAAVGGGGTAATVPTVAELNSSMGA